MKIKSALKYKYKGAVKSILIFFTVLTLLLFGMALWFSQLAGENSTTYFSGYSFAAIIMMFVVGICSVRDDLRLFIQNGIARKTAFVSEIAVALFSAIVVSIGGEIFMLMGRLVSGRVERFFVQDLYPVIYAGGSTSLTVWQHIESIALSSAFILAAFAGGMFFSLMFYRLNKAWSIVAAVSIPFVLLGLIPNLLYRYYAQTSAVVNFVAASSWNFVLVLLLLSVLTLFIDWMFARRVHIRGL